MSLGGPPATSFGHIEHVACDVEEYIDGSGAEHSVKLLYRRFSPPGAPAASVVLCHGFGEHSGRFVHVAAALVEGGCVVHTVDLRGHGYSGGSRADGFKYLIDDLRLVVRRANVGLPMFFYGHSMGGMLILRLLQLHPDMPVAGAIITSPLLRLHSRIPLPNWKKFLLKLAAPLLGDVLVGSNVDPCSLSSLSSEIRTTFHDRLCLPFMTLRFASAMLEAADAAMAAAPEFAYPVILVHGENDVITDPTASVEFASAVDGPSAVAHLIPGGKHELHNDVQFPQLLSLVREWMREQLATGSATLRPSDRVRAASRTAAHPPAAPHHPPLVAPLLTVARILNRRALGTYRVRHLAKWAVTAAWPFFFWILLPLHVAALLAALLLWRPSRVPWKARDTVATLWLGPLYFFSVLVREYCGKPHRQ